MQCYPHKLYKAFRDPYSVFLRVVSQASKPDGILARLHFGFPGQIKSAELLKNAKKIVGNMSTSDKHFISVRFTTKGF